MRRLVQALAFALALLVAVAASAGPKVHRVARGNTLGKIAKRYHITVDALCHANDISKKARIKIGQKLLIPPKSDKDGSKTRKVLEKRRAEKKKAAKKPAKKAAAKGSRGKNRWHRVYKKQNLGSIARRYNTTVAAIVYANDIKKKERIHPGLKLIIPTKHDKDGKQARKIFDKREREPPAEGRGAQEEAIQQELGKVREEAEAKGLCENPWAHGPNVLRASGESPPSRRHQSEESHA